MIQLISLLALVIALGFSSSVTPQHFNFHFQQLAGLHPEDELKFFQYSLGESSEGHDIWAYAWTAIPGVNTVQDLIGKPAALITSLMNANQSSSSRMLISFLESLPERVNVEDQLHYMMQHSAVWVIPYVNIDRYYDWMEASPIDKTKLHKNKQRGNQNCQKQFQYGININRNFDTQWGTISSSKDPCGQQYRGWRPFSSSEASAIKKFYQKFAVKLAIDLHDFGNEWVYPFAYDTTGKALKSHPLYYQYEQINKQLKNQQYKVSTWNYSYKQTADGVYIDWALNQGAVSYTFRIGNSFDNGASLLDDIQGAINGFYTVLRHNSYNYRFYKTPNKKLYVYSFSMIDLEIRIQNNYEELGPILIRSGQSHVIDLPSPMAEALVLVEGSLKKYNFYLESLQKKDIRGRSANIIKNKISNLVSFKGVFFLTFIIGMAYLAYKYLLKSKPQRSNKLNGNSDLIETERLKSNEQQD